MPFGSGHVNAGWQDIDRHLGKSLVLTRMAVGARTWTDGPGLWMLVDAASARMPNRRKHVCSESSKERGIEGVYRQARIGVRCSTSPMLNTSNVRLKDPFAVRLR
ncbi:hypothetical protein VKT23_000059 [Stygiomarasmius scandens]|uniref:Uncharacterized protein n=1 Tax=Marasmiellus scandens TaxID=2682957 RepID=A0ABR1K3F7_9AGAR